MTTGRALTYVVVDTSVLSYFTAQSKDGKRYRELLGERVIALSYFAETELAGRNWGEQRMARLEALYRECVRLPAVEATSTWYNRARVRRRELRLAQVGDNDLRIIAHAAEYGVPYMSHDRNACAVARALGVEVLTALDDG